MYSHKKNNTEFLLLPFTRPILCEVALSSLSSLLTTETALSSACCLVFLFTYHLSKQQEMLICRGASEDEVSWLSSGKLLCIYLKRAGKLCTSARSRQAKCLGQHHQQRGQTARYVMVADEWDKQKRQKPWR